MCGAAACRLPWPLGARKAPIPHAAPTPLRNVADGVSPRPPRPAPFTLLPGPAPPPTHAHLLRRAACDAHADIGLALKANQRACRVVHDGREAGVGARVACGGGGTGGRGARRGRGGRRGGTHSGVWRLARPGSVHS